MVLRLEVNPGTSPDQVDYSPQTKLILLVLDNVHDQVQELRREGTHPTLSAFTSETPQKHFKLLILDRSQSSCDLFLQLLVVEVCSFLNVEGGPEEIDKVIQSHDVHLLNQICLNDREQVV